jgi:hypothetical protein
VHLIQGVGASFQLVLENLEFGASYECNILHIRKNYVVFSHLGFHINYGVLCIYGYFLCPVD